MNNQDLKSIAKKFLLMGVTAAVTANAIIFTAVSVSNSYKEALYEMKAVKVYNEIWTNIDKKDMSQDIESYKKHVMQAPNLYRLGILKATAEKAILPNYLPSAEEVEESALTLSKKTKII